MANVAQLHCAGPAHIYIGPQIGRPGSTGSPIYFGTCAEAPFILVQKMYEGAPNDIAGKVPMDVSYQGQMGFLSFDFTRWSNIAEYWVNDFPHQGFGAAPIAPGTDLAGDVGTLVSTERAGFTVWVLMPYAATKAAMAGDFPGYRFLACSPVGEPIKTRVGTSVKRLNVNFLATRLYVTTTGANILYDTNVGGLPPIQ